MFIYKAQNKINNKIYIGTTNVDLDKRIYQHWGHPKYSFGKALRKYGIQSFEISIIDSTLLREIANEKEQYWIKFYDCKTPKGYNLTDGGEGNSSKRSEEVRQKIRIKGIGRRHSEETRKRLSEIFKGHKISEETRKKISKANKGNHHSEETKRKISENLKDRHLSKETKRKMSKAKKGKSLSEEHKRKLSESHKGKTVGERHWNWKGGITPCKNRIRAE